MRVINCEIRNNHGVRENEDWTGKGLFIEISWGPVLVDGCTITGNRIGVNVANTPNVTIRNCRIADNRETQIAVELHDRGKSFATSLHPLRLESNTLMAAAPDALLIGREFTSDKTYADILHNQLAWKNNVCITPGGEKPFLYADPEGTVRRVSVKEWVDRVPCGENAIFAVPLTW